MTKKAIKILECKRLPIPIEVAIIINLRMVLRIDRVSIDGKVKPLI